MSMLVKLQVRGIRSFGAKSEDEQVIYFKPPLTLILGANGCGKTTIIECLKYALTGELPPGCKQGQGFVHDPKISRASESLGQVKLVVKNLRDEKITVTRSMKSGNKRGKPSFETIDGTIFFENDNEKNQISKRCIDINVEMCQFMGVSKAIINNVLLCHQEDSSWPLEDGKKLKEKFDAIFGTTEYNKAIDKIIKLRKAEMASLNIKHEELKGLVYIKKQAESKILDLQKAENKLDNLRKTRLKFDEEIKPVEERLEKIYLVEKEIGRLQGQKIELTTKLKNCSDQVQSLKSKIKTLFDGDKMSLDKKIREFRSEMHNKREQQSALEDQLTGFKEEAKRIQSYLSDIERKSAGLVLHRQQEQEYLSERAQKLQQMCRDLNIPINMDFEDGDVTNVIKSIKSALKAKEIEINEIGKNNEKIDNEMQIEIDEIRVNKTKIETDISSKTEQRSKLTAEHRKIQTEIENVEASAKTLKEVTKNYEKVNKVYEDFVNVVNLDDIKKNITEKRGNIKVLEEKLEKIDEQLKFLNSISKLKAEITLKEKELEKRESEVRRVKSKHSDNLIKIFGSRSIESNYKRNVQNAYENVKKQLNDLNRSINDCKLKEKELQTIRKQQKDDLNKAEKELEESEEKIYDKCQATPYEDLISRIKENVDKLQLEHGAIKSSEAMYKRYINKIQQDPCCPLCHKDMSQDEATDLTSELSDEIHRLPENIQKTEKQLKKEQIKYENLLQLKPIIDRVNILKRDIPKFKTNLKETEQKLKEAADEIESNQLATSEPNSLSDLASTMLGDMSLLDEAMKDVGRVKSDLEAVKGRMPAGDSSACVDDVQLEKSTTSGELKNERSEVEELQTKYEKETETLNRLREEKNNLKSRQIKLQEGVQALTQLKARIEEITKQIELHSKEILELKTNLRPLNDKMQSAIVKKDRVKEENKKSVRDLENVLNGYRKTDHDIERITKELKNLASMNLAKEISQLKITKQRHLDNQTEINKKIDRMSNEITALNKDLTKQEVDERNLIDNRELMVLKEKEADLNKQYEDLSKDIGGLDYKNLSIEKQEMAAKREQLMEQKGEISGEMGEVNNQINNIRKDLDKPEHKNAVKNYRKIFYEVETMKKIISDMGQYRVALDWALMKYHSEKMERVNELIREYWRQIYRGNDIDYIQIQTDEIKSDGADKKRNYNYRVVQSKNNVEIDMKGRCSAGQRVLASLIIRMALAETFSVNCGVLALDEPTTNLDRSNILSLCEALNRIVESHSTQNFMLIIITHDEDFISTLGKIHHYHRVSRNDEGKSIIQKIRIG